MSTQRRSAMCRSRRALVRDGADTAKNEPLTDYRLIVRKPAAAKDAALRRAVRGAAWGRLNPRRPKTQPYIGRSVAQPKLDYSRPWRPKTQPYIGRSEAQPAAFNRKCKHGQIQAEASLTPCFATFFEDSGVDCVPRHSLSSGGQGRSCRCFRKY